MGVIRPFGQVLEELGGLCQELADAHSHEVAAADARRRLPEIPAHPEAPPSTPSRLESVPPGFSGLRLAAVENGAAATRPPSAGNKWQTLHNVSPAEVTPEGPSTVTPRLKVSTFGHDVSIPLKKVEQQDLKAFKQKKIWNITDEDLLRIKCKARRGNQSVDGVCRKSGPTAYSSARMESQWDWFMIHPQSKSRLCWDLAGIIWLTYDVVMLPIQVFPLPYSVAVVALDYLGNSYWTGDIAASFLTGTYSKSLPLMRFKPVARKYIRSWLAFDIFLVFIGWTSVAAETMSGDVESMQMARATRTARFLRILRYLRLARLLRIVKSMRMFGDIQARANSEAGLFALGVVKLNGALVLMTHVLACSWYGLGNVPGGWARVEATGPGNATGIVHWDVGDQYLYSYQWSLARLHPSSIEKNLLLRTTNERIFAVVGGIIAMIVGAGFISTITNMMREFQEKHHRRKRNLQLVQAYVLKYTISPQLAVRAKRYIEIEHENKLRAQREAELMTILPHDLLLDFQYEAFSPVTAKHEFFAEIHDQHLRTHYDICHRALSSALVISGEIVFAAGDACSKMRFVTSGKFSYAIGNAHTALKDCSAYANEEDDEEEVKTPCDKDETTNPNVAVGTWLSEAVLWTTWEHHGAFYAENGGTVLEVSAEDFAVLFQEHEQALVLASNHACCFLEDLNAVGTFDLSDLPLKLPEPCDVSSTLVPYSRSSQQSTHRSSQRPTQRRSEWRSAYDDDPPSKRRHRQSLPDGFVAGAEAVNID